VQKLRPDPITKEEISKYLESQDDFALELRTLAILKGNDYEASHGGTYSDPRTNTDRQYDIRASIKSDRCHVKLAVECKCLQENFPLLVSCVHRNSKEAFHDLIVSWQAGKAGKRPYPTYQQDKLRVTGNQSFYRVNEYVGKSTTQIGISASKDREFVSGDGEVYGKWSQAIASSFDLIVDAGKLDNEVRITAILPILVVPDGTLWQVLYGENGVQVGQPNPASESCIYIDKTYTFEKYSFTISHLNIFTFGKFQWFVNQLKWASQSSNSLFPTDSINMFFEKH